MVLGEVVQRVVWSRYSGPPRERLLGQSVDLYDKLSAIPWISDVLHEGTSVGIPSLSQAENFLSACYNLGFDDDEAFGLWRTTWFVISSELQWNGEARVRRGDHMPAPEFTDADMDAHPSAARVFGNGNRCPRDTASSPTSPRSSTAPSPTRAPQFRPPPARRFARRRRGRSTGRRKWRRPEETGQPIAC